MNENNIPTTHLRALPAIGDVDKRILEAFAGDAAARELMKFVVDELVDHCFEARELGALAASEARGCDPMTVAAADAALLWFELAGDLDEVLGHVLKLGAAAQQGPLGTDGAR